MHLILERSLLLHYFSRDISRVLCQSAMTKGFKLRMSLPSLSLCRSKKSSSMARSPLAAKTMFTAVNLKTSEIAYPKLPAPPPSTPNHPLSKRSLSKVLSFGSWRCISKLSTTYASSMCNMDSPGYKMMKDYDSLQKLCNSPAYSDDLDESVIMWPFDPFKTKKNNDKDLATSFSVSFSSADHNNSFTSEDNDEQNEDENEGLLSSCSSMDSSYDFGYSINNTSEKPTCGSKRKKKNTKVRRLERRASKARRDCGDHRITIAAMCETEIGSAAVKKSALGRMIPCVVEGMANESYAVMKKSSNPFEDFKKSMIEMILEKEIYEPEELEKLLMCFLSLNAREHHAVIVEAFTEVWEELFCEI